MSFVVTLYVREGIVMASDSRMTLNVTHAKESAQTTQISVSQSDSVYKTFLTPSGIGISTFGDADVRGVPIAGYLEDFIRERLGDDLPVDAVPERLLTYFARLPGPPKAGFHIAGYAPGEGDEPDQQVWHVSVVDEGIRRINPPGEQGVGWGGEADILTRLVQPVGLLKKDGTLAESLPTYKIPWQFFTLQDAIDYAVYAVQVTIDSIRFQPRPKTIGGPVDVLVIKPDDAFWVQRKELRVR